jgi:phosphate-selective porin OprO/OprP
MSFLRIVLWCLMLGSIVVAAPAMTQETGPATTDEGTADELAPAPPRPMTQSELRREIDLLQRQLEELILRIGAAPPTEAQRQQLADLAAKLAELRKDLASAKDRDDRKATGTSFKARWMRLRGALDDFTNWDVDDGMFRIRLGLRFQLDTTAGEASDRLQAQVGEIDESVDFRRARIFARGRLLRRYDFRFEYDFGADQGLKDAFLEGVKYTKYVKWRIGQFREPFSLARQTGAHGIGQLEFPLPVQALTPGRNVGLSFRHAEADERLFWAVALTTNGQTTDDNRSNSNVTLTARLTGLPIFRDRGRRLLHLGGAFSVRSPTGDESQVVARPEARFAPFFVDTGVFPADRIVLVGAEVATVLGSTWIQAEWIRSFVDAPDVGDPAFGGAYVEAGRFLTGESRFYRTHEGSFGRLTPNRLFHGGNPFKGKGDGGALEITGRYSTLDLNGGAITGGEMHNLTLGLNWYLSAASRFMLNYIYSDVRDVGSANLLLIRFQFNP